MTDEAEAGVTEPAAVVHEESSSHTGNESDKEHNFAAMRETLAAQKKQMKKDLI